MFKMTYVLYAALTVFQGYCLQYFFGNFLETRMRGRWNGMYVAGLYAALRTAVVWCSPPGYEDYRVAAGTLALSLCILSALSLCFYKALRLITVFLVVSFQVLLDISKYTVAILLNVADRWVLDIINWCAGKGMLPSEKSFGMAVKAGVAGTQLIQYAGIALLLYFSLRKIVGDFREKDYVISRTELLFILVPSAVGMMICMLLRIIMITLEDGIPKMLYDRYPILVIVIPTILLLSLLSILYGVKLFQDMIYWNREKSGRIVLENQISSLQEHMEEMERIYSGIRGMKHDMKNTLAVIQRLSAGEGGGELQEYLSELNRGLEKLEVRFRTGNTVVDTLLNMKYHEAVRDMPDLRMDADKLLLPQGIHIHSYDIGVILGNAVDNAIEACRKLKAKEPGADAFIRISSLQKGNLLILKVENSFDGRLVLKAKEEFPVTDKADRKSHGIGLANIKSTAEKYQGAVDFKVNGRLFILSVMMKNEGERKMDFGVTGKLGGYHLAEQYRKNAAGKSGRVSFAELAATKAAGKTENVSFKEMLKSKYPGAYYNVMDTSKIDGDLWGRNDYPWDKYFSNNADDSVLNWKPSGAEPDMQSPAVRAKMNAMLGKIAVVIPPELEEKMKNNTELAQKVMERVDSFLLTNSTPGENEGFLMTFDENGEINHACVVGELKFTVSSSEFVEARRAREAKHAEYERLAEEAALKRRLMEQEADERYYKDSMTKKAVSIAAYEAAGILR